MKFNGFEINVIGQISDSIKDEYNYENINNQETTGHINDLYTKRMGNIEITVYKDPLDPTFFGSEIYYYKPQSSDIKYSRNYPKFDNFPAKYEDILEEMKKKFAEIYKGYSNYDNFPLI